MSGVTCTGCLGCPIPHILFVVKLVLYQQIDWVYIASGSFPSCSWTFHFLIRLMLSTSSSTGGAVEEKWSGLVPVRVLCVVPVRKCLIGSQIMKRQSPIDQKSLYITFNFYFVWLSCCLICWKNPSSFEDTHKEYNPLLINGPLSWSPVRDQSWLQVSIVE